MRLHDALEVGAVLSEGKSPANIPAAKDALSRFVSLALVLSGFQEILEAVDEVAAVQNEFERLDS